MLRRSTRGFSETIGNIPQKNFSWTLSERLKLVSQSHHLAGSIYPVN
jgi:hypothetical protein